jgi:uncharacterized Zn finger protein
MADGPGSARPTVVVPAFGKVRTSARSLTWWGRAWVRTFEENALEEKDLVTGRRFSRAGVLGAIGLSPGTATSVITEATGDRLLVGIKVAELSDQGWRDFATEAARASGHAADLVSGVLTPALVEHCDEAGVELFPGPSDVEAECDCEAWAQPCGHALALMYQLAWLIDVDPFVLLLLRGRSRDAVLGAVSGQLDGEPPRIETDLDDAVSRAAEILALADAAPSGHGLADAAVASYDEQVALLTEPG